MYRFDGVYREMAQSGFVVRSVRRDPGQATSVWWHGPDRGWGGSWGPLTESVRVFTSRRAALSAIGKTPLVEIQTLPEARRVRERERHPTARVAPPPPGLERRVPAPPIVVPASADDPPITFVPLPSLPPT